MEFLFPIIVVAFGGLMVFFRWRARQRRQLYGSGNAGAGATGVMVGLGTVMGEDKAEGSEANSGDGLLAAAGATSLGDGYNGGWNSDSSGSDGGEGGGGDGGGDGGGGGGD